MISTKNLVLLATIFNLLLSCSRPTEEIKPNAVTNSSDSATHEAEKQKISDLLDTLNVTAARADFNNYFNCYAEDATFMGTDATEHWDKKAFMIWSKPFFDKGKAWNFTSMQRHIYFDNAEDIAWFDELLNTQMKICRGSGVVIKQNNQWKLQQYVLSSTIPNNLLNDVIKIKAAAEDSIINNLSSN